MSILYYGQNGFRDSLRVVALSYIEGQTLGSPAEPHDSSSWRIEIS